MNLLYHEEKNNKQNKNDLKTKSHYYRYIL